MATYVRGDKQRFKTDSLTLSHDLFPAFFAYMADDGMPTRELVYLVEKPWKWTTEFNEWVDTLLDDND